MALGDKKTSLFKTKNAFEKPAPSSLFVLVFF